MTTEITKKILIQISKHYSHRLLSSQKNVNNCYSAYQTIYFKRIKERSNMYSLSKLQSHRILCYVKQPLYINFQRRCLSNEATFEKSEPPDPPVADEAVKIFTSNMPEIVRNVSDWKIVELAQNSLLKVHEFTGLPWWASIAITAFIARATVTLPFSIIQARTSAKLQMIHLEMDDVVKKLKREANYACAVHHWPEKLAQKKYQQNVRKHYNELIVRENCHPAKGFILMWVQLPLWFAFSFATRNLCYMLPKPDISAQITFMEMSVGGFGWVKNLVDVDHYMILPVALALVNLSILEVHHLFRTAPLRRIDRWKSNLFRVISVIMIPIAASLPAATNVYWLTSSLFGLMQAFILNSTRLRRFFHIPLTKTELEHPYQHFYKNLKTKLRLS